MCSRTLQPVLLPLQRLRRPFRQPPGSFEIQLIVNYLRRTQTHRLYMIEGEGSKLHPYLRVGLQPRLLFRLPLGRARKGAPLGRNVIMTTMSAYGRKRLVQQIAPP